MSIELKRLRFTAHDVQEMIATGIIAGDARIELWDGDIIEMSPIGGLHSFAVKMLMKTFGRLHSEDRIDALCQGPMEVDEYTILEPDYVVLRPGMTSSRTGIAIPEETLLVIEVSDTTYATDRHRKAARYAAAGIPEYWIVNIARREVEILRQPSGDAYHDIGVVRPGDVIHPLSIADIAIPVDGLFAPEKQES